MFNNSNFSVFPLQPQSTLEVNYRILKVFLPLIRTLKRQLSAFSVARDVTHQLQEIRWKVENTMIFVRAIQNALKVWQLKSWLKLSIKELLADNGPVHSVKMKTCRAKCSLEFPVFCSCSMLFARLNLSVLRIWSCIEFNVNQTVSFFFEAWPAANIKSSPQHDRCQ